MVFKSFDLKFEVRTFIYICLVTRVIFAAVAIATAKFLGPQGWPTIGSVINSGRFSRDAAAKQLRVTWSRHGGSFLFLDKHGGSVII